MGPGTSSRRDWALALAHTHWLRGQRDLARAYADSARQAPQGAGAQDIALRGVASAYLGASDEALNDGRRAVALDPIAADRQNGPYTQLLLARIEMLVGEPDSAAAALKAASGVPGFYLTPAWLGIDPTWADLRRRP